MSVHCTQSLLIFIQNLFLHLQLLSQIITAIGLPSSVMFCVMMIKENPISYLPEKTKHVNAKEKPILNDIFTTIDISRESETIQDRANILLRSEDNTFNSDTISNIYDGNIVSGKYTEDNKRVSSRQRRKSVIREPTGRNYWLRKILKDTLFYEVESIFLYQ